MPISFLNYLTNFTSNLYTEPVGNMFSLFLQVIGRSVILKKDLVTWLGMAERVVCEFSPLALILFLLDCVSHPSVF